MDMREDVDKKEAQEVKKNKGDKTEKCLKGRSKRKAIQSALC